MGDDGNELHECSRAAHSYSGPDQPLMRLSPTCRPSTILFSILSATLCLSLAAPTARAQGFVSAGDTGQTGCDSRQSNFGLIAQAAQSCVLGGITSASSASANAGIVRTGALSSIMNNTYGFGSNTGTATWIDWLTITSGTAAYAKFDFAVYGSTFLSTGSATGRFSYWESYATGSFQTSTNGVFNDVVRNYQSISSPDLQWSNQLHADLFSVLVPIVNGLARLNYTMESTSSVSVYNIWTSLGMAENPVFSAESNFRNTAGVTGVSFLDGNNQAVNGVSYEFQNGTQFYDPSVPTTPVPEPSAWALMAVGLAGLFALGRGRRPTVLD